MAPYQVAIILAFLSLLGGFLIFHLILKLLPYLERRENLLQKKEVLKEAERQQRSILEDAKLQAEENQKLFFEELEVSIQQLCEDLKAEENDLEAQEASWDQEEKRVAKREQTLSERQDRLIQLDAELIEQQGKLSQSQSQLVAALERRADADSTSITTNLCNQLKEYRQLECQKLLKSLQEDLRSTARKKAQRILDRTHARYAPDFVWPKASNVVEVPSEKLVSVLQQDGNQLLEQLSELSGASIKLIPSSSDNKLPAIVKVAGGYGIYREAARLALNELLARPLQWAKLQSLYHQHRQKLEQEALNLGQKAVTELQLEGVHVELQKLIGALNWRTSYRQNQWYHTVEVAVLAGIIASELGVDPKAAKRVGLLHDIGKAIDYRIEGSHAVISGDYADRYGEKRSICDTVMSHHADLLVESPLAYVLRAADTLSGARPGARVNLEEGYQIRLDAIAETVRSFPGILDLAIMNGGREVHVLVHHKKVAEQEVRSLSEAIARKIEEDVAYPGQIKIMVSRSFEAVSVA